MPAHFTVVLVLEVAAWLTGAAIAAASTADVKASVAKVAEAHFESDRRDMIFLRLLWGQRYRATAATDHYFRGTPPAAAQSYANSEIKPCPLQTFWPLQAFSAVLQSLRPLQAFTPPHFTVAPGVVAELTGAAMAAASTADVKASAVTVREADMRNSPEWLPDCAAN